MRLSGSKMGLFALCQFWAQEGVAWTERSPGRGARVGLAAHAANEAIQNRKTPDYPALAEKFRLSVGETRSLARIVDTFRSSVHVPSMALAELTWAYDPIAGTSRQLGIGLDRKYEEAGLLPSEIPATADLVWMEGGVLVVADLKTGIQRNLAEAAWNAQMLFLALAGAKATGADTVRVIVYKVDEENVWPTFHDLDEHELRLLELDRRAEVEAFRAGPVEPNAGPHCSDMWCPAVESCPLAEKGLGGVVPSERLVRAHRLLGPIQSPDEASYRATMLPLLEKALEAFKANLREYADTHGPVSTPHGTWGPVEVPQEHLVATPEALAVIEDYLGEESIPVAVSLEFSAASIKRAVEAKGIYPVGPAVKKIVASVKRTGSVQIRNARSYVFRRGRAA